MPTIGERLITMKKYTGMSLAEIAAKGGYRGASSIQKLFKADYNPGVLPEEVAVKLARAFVGRGDPPIRLEEIKGMTGSASEMDTVFSQLSHYAHVISDTIALFRTERIDDAVITANGAKVPLFMRSDNMEGLHYSAPLHLRGKQLIGMYSSVGNMWPRFEEGEVLFYEHKTPASQGDDVVVTLVSEANLDGGMVVGRLYLLQDDEVHLDVFTPRDRLTIPRKSIISIRRILTRAEMLDPPISVM